MQFSDATLLIIGHGSTVNDVRFKTERQNGERFGDWCARVLWPELNLPERC